MKLASFASATLLASLLLASSACVIDASGADTGDDLASFDEVASSLEGIYRVEMHAFNTDACDLDGAPVLASEPYAFARTRTVFGQRYLEVLSCASLADCRSKAADTDGAFTTDFSFTTHLITGQRTLLGEGVTTGFAGDGPLCSGGDVSSTWLYSDGATIRIDRAITPADPYPAEGDACTSEGAQAAAEGNSCAQLEHLRATRVERL